MYAAYFGLKQEPFSIAPDPRLLFMSGQHREALAHLLYGVQGGGGFVLLTGEIGTGKTTVCRSFLEQVPPHVNLAYIFNPKLTVLELLETVCHEFGIDVPRAEGRAATVKDFLDPLNDFLLRAHAAGRNNVLVIDEAQNLAPEVLEQLRLLTNLETSERKLLQIILIGQPELRAMLARPELEQLAQRVIARYHLGPLTEDESAQYVRHRLEVCGLQGPLPFDRGALKGVHRESGGVPRRINLLCDRALLGAYAGGQAQVTRAVVARAADEVFLRTARPAPAWRRLALAGVGGLAVGVGLYAMATREAPLAEARPSAALQPAPAVPTAPPALAQAAVSQSGGQAVASQVGAQAAAPQSSVQGAAPQVGAQVLAPPAAAAPAMSPSANPPAQALLVATQVPPPRPVLLRDESAAWRELAQVWKLSPPPDAEPCAALARERVQCFNKTLSLALIRQLGRPGIVTLDKATGQPSYAILAALNGQHATLRAAGTEQTVTLAALAARWDGDFGTLWRAPEGYDGHVADGQGGLTVAWVADKLAAAKGAPPPRHPPVLDNALRSDVKAFQLAQGLPADGRPGPLTYMQLNRASGVDEPRLRTDP
ncbi:AAA family ATPase [Ramlibacter sp. G-1-2-2]|uniref:AAA family ATPase n=1 Tax=Ramlibacter agri TaxID=2728837 RepID=A0A848H944_9BURK|nr:ExeA family protein [Ramlibacter agri]NML45981.1 AAA family ATPase [Ramlibacter agri]